MFFTIITIVLALSAVWWIWMDARLRRDGYGPGWRIGVLVWAGLSIGIPLTTNGMKSNHLFQWLPAAAFLWLLLALPLTLLMLALLKIGLWIFRREEPRAVEAMPAEAPSAEIAIDVRMSRRQILTVAALAAPPVITAGLTGIAISQLGVYRTRAIDLELPGFPLALAGMTVAVVADIHIGPFTTPKMLEAIVESTNTIHNGGPADLVILAGDLINNTLRDLPAGLELAKALRSRLGTYAIVGNHDVMDWAPTFFREFDRSGIPLLRDEVLTVTAAPGVDLQLLGVMWYTHDEYLFKAVAKVAALRNPTLFPICLAHHPHAWDEAQQRGLPLVVSGHTHGGQIMLTKNIGGGPLKFRYWTGVYQRGDSQLVVSNGIGNWFPLRINAPAELLKLTLWPQDA